MKLQTVWDKCKSPIIVVVTTLLIWLIADQYVREEQIFRIPVRVVSRDPDVYAAFAEPPYQLTLHVTLVGPRRHMKIFSDLLSARSFLEATVDAPELVGPEPQSVSTVDDILKKIQEVRESRLSIKSVSPRAAKIIIDRYEEIQDVAVQPTFGALKVVNAVCSPEKVAVRLPRFARRQLLKEPIIKPEAGTAVREATKEKPDFQVPLKLSLGADQAIGVQIIPDKVTLTGVVESLQASAVKGPVQITFSIPDEVQKRFSVVVRSGTSFRQDIEVTGPADRLEALDPRDIRAFVDVMAGDMDEAGREITRGVQYVLPPGFSLAPNAVQHEVTFTLVPMASPASPGG